MTKTAKDAFKLSTQSFPGTPTEQAQFLLRRVKPLGNIDATAAELPAALSALMLGQVPADAALRTKLRTHIQSLGLDEEKHLGGDLDGPVAKSGGVSARYFVIHDTSSPTLPKNSTFPANINETSWSGNKLSPYIDPPNGKEPVAHVFVNRAGQSATGHDFDTRWRATKFEGAEFGFGTEVKGLFLHCELIQPRIRNNAGLDQFAPDPGFPRAQLDRLALLFVCASVRRGSWLMPAFHGVLDEELGDGHDDPQKFDLPAWGDALRALLSALGVSLPAPERVMARTMAISAGRESAAGYTPPAASKAFLAGIPFGRAERVGEDYTDKFDAHDASPDGRADPSLCRGIFKLPGGCVFWESKMAIDADGSPHESVLRSSGGSDPNTSLRFRDAHRSSINPEIVPYYVQPKLDNSDGLNFVEEFDTGQRTLGVVVYKGKAAGAIFADAGPSFKIGEASIRVHELLLPPPAPWKGNPANLILKDVSVETGVLYFLFPGVKFDIDDFGAGRQKEMATAIHAAAMVEFAKLKSNELPVGREGAFAMAAGTAAAARTDAFIYSSAWRATCGDLGVPVKRSMSDDACAVAAIERFAAERPGKRVMFGFDAGNVEDGTVRRALAAARAIPKSTLGIYVEGPGGPTGREWDDDEKERIFNAAKSVEVQGDDFDEILPDWDGGEWWTYTAKQLKDYKRKGFEAAEIDNLYRVLEAIPGGLLAFFEKYAAERAQLPALILKNLTAKEFESLQAAVASGRLPRAMFADFHICEDDAEVPANFDEQEERSAALGIKTIRSDDTENYRARGDNDIAGAHAAVAPIREAAMSARGAREDAGHCCAGGGDHDNTMTEAAALAVTKPSVDRDLHSPNQNSRNGTDIDHIVLHYTTSTSIEGTISHFENPAAQVSAHYIIGRDGELVQMVADERRAWHAGNGAVNDRSIGIEHVAKIGQKITADQAATSIALIRWLMREYDIDSREISPHRCHRDTDCCGDLFKDFGGGANKSCGQQQTAIRDWLTANGVA